MQCPANWPTIGNFAAVVNGGRLPAFAAYVERSGEIVYTDAEINLLLALTTCPTCGDILDGFLRCTCDYR